MNKVYMHFEYDKPIYVQTLSHSEWDISYHGMIHLLPWYFSANCWSFRIRSAWIWKSVLWDGKPTSYIPLGYATPSLVPCPPARRRTATLFWEIWKSPKKRKHLYHSIIQHFRVTHTKVVAKHHSNCIRHKEQGIHK